MKQKTMYEDAEKEWKTYNPAVGCRYDCIYCRPSFKKMLKFVGSVIGCDKCKHYEPHYHPERLETSKIPSSKGVFVFGNGDFSVYKPSFVRRTFEVIKTHNIHLRERYGYVSKTYYFQTKQPHIFKRYKGEWPENTKLVCTIETDMDSYYREISKAPFPSYRLNKFLTVDYLHKVITIEPIMRFSDRFAEWILRYHKTGDLDYVWVGKNSRPKQVSLPTPSEERIRRFIEQLRGYGIEVKEK